MDNRMNRRSSFPIVRCVVLATVTANAACGASGEEREICCADRDACVEERNACVATCAGNLSACAADRDACTADLNVCSIERNVCAADRDACEEDLGAFEDNQYRGTETVSNLDLFTPMCGVTNSDRIIPDGSLGTFQDSKFGGRSQVWWRVNRSCDVGTTGQGCCVELSYRFVARRTSAYTPYAGVLSYFTYIPHGPIDASDYDGLGMLARAEPTIGPTPRVSFQLADIGPNTSSEANPSSCRDGFFETPVFEFNAAPSSFEVVNLNYTDFARPSWYGCNGSAPLQTHRIYKFAIVLLNTSTTESELEGKVVFSNLHFR